MTAKQKFLELDFNRFLENLGHLETRKLGDIEVPEFEHHFEEPFLDSFDTVNFMVGKPKDDNPNNPNIATVSFWNQFGDLTFDQMEYVVNELMKLCRINDDYWTHVDKMRITSGVWRGRSLISDITVFIALDEIKGFKLDIIGFNDFLNKIANT